MFNEIQGNLFGELARRLFGGAKTLSVAPEISVQVDLFAVPELWALHGGSLTIGVVFGLAAGGAGFRSQIMLRNPQDSRLIVVLERLRFTTPTTEILAMGWQRETAEPGSSTGNLVLRDTRRATTVGASGPVGARIRTRNNAASALGTNTTQIRSVLNADQDILLNAIIAPGWSWIIEANADNTAIASAITFIARERPCLPDELTGL